MNMTIAAQPLRISVITVCYNSASTIQRCLESVAAQTHPAIEHIVIDGASRDGTADIVRRAPHVALCVSEPDRGIYDAMNKGLERATGDVVAFLNADDRYAHADVLSHVAAQMTASADDLLFGDVAFFRPDAPDRLVRRYRSGHFTPERIGWGWMPAHPAMFVRRSMFNMVGPFRTHYRIAADYEWVARAFARRNWPHRHVAEVWVHMQTGGVSTRGWRNTLLLNQEVLRACRENGIPTNWFKILSKYPRKALEYWRE